MPDSVLPTHQVELITTIEAKQKESDALAKEMIEDSKDFLKVLEDLAERSFADNTVWANAPNYEAEVEYDVDEPSKPNIRNILFSAPDGPTLPTINGFSIGALPVLSAKPPAIYLPTTPTLVVPDVPVEPTLDVVTTPDAPVIDFPTAPTLSAITIPDAPDIPTLPAFTSQVPTVDFTIPSSMDLEFTEIAYQSSLLDEVKARLEVSVGVGGGTGLGANYEQALFDRTMMRQVEAARRDLDAIDDKFSAAGWPAPPGARDAAMKRRLRDHLDNERDVNEKILIQEMEQTRKHYEFLLTTSVGLEQILIAHHDKVMDRALEAARSYVDTAIKYYDLRVAQFNARLMAFKTEADVYKLQIEAALQNIELYSAVMRGKAIEADIQKSLVDIYDAQLRGVQSIIQVYATEMEAAKIHSDIERNKIMLYGQQIDAFKAQVEAKTAEYGAYRAAIDGELAKANLYNTQVGAYRAEVEAYGSNVAAQSKQVEVKIEQQRLTLDSYRARIEGFKANVEAYSVYVRAALQEYGDDTTRYNANLAAEETAARLKMQNTNLKIESLRFAATLANKNLAENLRHIEQVASVKLSAASTGGNLLATIAGAALSQYNSVTGLLSDTSFQEDTSTAVPAP